MDLKLNMFDLEFGKTHRLLDFKGLVTTSPERSSSVVVTTSQSNSMCGFNTSLQRVNICSTPICCCCQ